MNWFLIQTLSLYQVSSCYVDSDHFASLPPATKLRQGNIFTRVCQEFCPQGGGACVVGGVGMCGRGYVWQGACVAGVYVAGGCAWCMVGGMHGRGVCMAGGHAWQGGVWQGGMHGRGACMAEGMCGKGCAWQGGMCGWGHAWQGV